MKKFILLSALAVLFILPGCKKEINNTYEVNQEKLLPPGAGKFRLKTNEQFVAILYTNLFQKALSANDVYAISLLMRSIGDKEVAREVIISNFLNKPGVVIPSHVSMWKNIDQFMIETYNRFLVRNPTEAEKAYFKKYITTHSTATDSSRVNPEIVYYSFTLSNEYMYY